MSHFRYSGNIPKERQIFNAQAIQGIEFQLKTLYRDLYLLESYTERIGKSILNEFDILAMGKPFNTILDKDSRTMTCRVCTLNITKGQIIPVALSLIKYLQQAGFAYKGGHKELNRASNQITLVLNLIKGLDPSLRFYTIVDAYCRAIWAYYFENQKILND